jgi:hypothetical protein
MCLYQVIRKIKKYERNFFAFLKSRKESDPELDPDPLVRGTDPQIWIRTKMSRIPNTTLNNDHMFQ